MSTKIDRNVLERQLKLAGNKGPRTTKPYWQKSAFGPSTKSLAANADVQVAGIVTLTTAALRLRPLIFLDATLEDEHFSLCFDELKKVDGQSGLGDCHYIAMWNNNNADNAIRQFAYYRDTNPGRLRETGLKDFLVLLSLYQTCR